MMAGPRIPMLFVGGRLSECASRNAHYSLLHNLGNRRKGIARYFWNRLPVLVRCIAKRLCPGTVAGAANHDASHHAGQFMRLAEIIVNPRHREDILEGPATLGIVC